MKNLLWFLLAGSRGGEMRVKILTVLQQHPMNANRLATTLNVDYKTIQHHLVILTKNNLLSIINKGGYGAMYFLSEEMKANLSLLEEIRAQFGKK